MNKKVFGLITLLPIAGIIIKRKVDYRSLMCSQQLEHYFNSEDMKPLRDWVSAHPKEILTRKKAASLLRGNKK